MKKWSGEEIYEVMPDDNCHALRKPKICELSLNNLVRKCFTVKEKVKVKSRKGKITIEKIKEEKE